MIRDPNSAVRGKCVWWREKPNEEDAENSRLHASERRIDCSCFVEGFLWEFAIDDLPRECPEARKCRYYARGY